MPEWNEIQPYVDKIGNVIAEIASGLGVAAEHVYGILVRQQFVEGCVWTGGGIVLWLVYVFMTRFLIRLVKEDDDWTPALILFGVFGGFGLVLLTVLEVVPNMMKMFNPEYYAMRDIIEMLKTLK